MAFCQNVNGFSWTVVVDKASGTTRMVECAPGLDMEDDDDERQSSVGTINLFDYLEKD